MKRITCNLTSRIIPIILIISILGCSKDSPKGPASFYISKITLPGGFEDRFYYSNGTELIKTEVYHDGTLLQINKTQLNSQGEIILNSYDWPSFSNVTSIKEFTFSSGHLTRIKMSVSNYGGASNPSANIYNFSLDGQNRLNSYTYGQEGYSSESGQATWLPDGVNVVQSFSSGTAARTFKVKSEGDDGSSVWSKLPPAAMATLLFQKMYFIEYFVPNRVTSAGSDSYGHFTYGEFQYDANGNLVSMKRTELSTGKAEYFTFEWKKVYR